MIFVEITSVFYVFYKYFLSLNTLKILKNIYKIIPALLIFYISGRLVLSFLIIDKILELIIVGVLLSIIYIIVVWFFSFNNEEKQMFGNILKSFKRG